MWHQPTRKGWCCYLEVVYDNKKFLEKNGRVELIKMCLSQNLETLNALNTVHLDRKVMDLKVFMLSLGSKNLQENDTLRQSKLGYKPPRFMGWSSKYFCCQFCMLLLYLIYDFTRLAPLQKIQSPSGCRFAGGARWLAAFRWIQYLQFCRTCCDEFVLGMGLHPMIFVGRWVGIKVAIKRGF